MPRRKLKEEHIRNLQRSGGSYHLTIPIRIVRKLRWRERQRLVVRQTGQSIRISDWEKPFSRRSKR
jgi:hypothetical protein